MTSRQGSTSRCASSTAGFATILGIALAIAACAPEPTPALSETPPTDLSSFLPSAIAFANRNVGWIGGTNAHGDGLILHTVDGGVTWTTSGLGEGRVREIAAIDDRQAFATLACEEHQFSCSSGTFRWDEDFGGWGQSASDRIVAMDFAGEHGVAVALPPNDEAPMRPSLLLNEDGGDTDWPPLDDPCPGEMQLAEAERTSAMDLVVLCLAEGGTGGTFKALLASKDGGATWVERARTQPGGLVVMGTPAGFALAADGTGWMWGTRMPLLETTDAGETWSPLDVADGDVRMVTDASYLAGGAGFALLHDPDRQATLLLWTRDGRTWDELGAWPLL